MPSWGEIGREIASVDLAQISPAASQFDIVRRKYLAQMHGLTGRATMIYATKWAMPNVGALVPPDMLSITVNDIHGFMEAVYGLTGRELDLIIHSPGGSAEAAEAIVVYLRSKFDHIRVFVPHMAMSAATMLACAADRSLAPLIRSCNYRRPSGRALSRHRRLFNSSRWRKRNPPIRQSLGRGFRC